jgi:hypothetical protein
MFFLHNPIKSEIMEAKVNYVSPKGKCVILAIETKIGIIVQRVSGFVSVEEGHGLAKGDVINIPATSVATETRVDKETGETFTWLVFK